MGGGGGGGPSRANLKGLEDIAKKTLREPEKGSRRNVFISFAYEDLAQVNLLRGQSKNENSDIEFNDWSLREPFDSKRADYIRKGIEGRISQSSATLVYISDKTASSKWVNWEINKSIELGKRVIAVYKKGAKPTKICPAIKAHGIKMIPWTHDGINKALS
jgi:hypothetical protein